MEKLLSKNALQLGRDYGITAEFICMQTAEQLALKLDDLLTLFDVFQASLYPCDQANIQGQDGMSESHKFTYEESIMVALLGQDYMKFIN